MHKTQWRKEARLLQLEATTAVVATMAILPQVASASSQLFVFARDLFDFVLLFCL